MCVQVELRRAEQLLQCRGEQLKVSKQLIQDQQDQLAQVTQELQDRERENLLLRSRDRLLQEGEPGGPGGRVLLRTLQEAEADGAAAAKEVSGLRETLCNLLGPAPQVSLVLVQDLVCNWSPEDRLRTCPLSVSCRSSCPRF